MHGSRRRPRARVMLTRVHSLLGLVPLSAYLVMHVYDNWPALRGRELWVDRALHVISRPWVIALFLLPLALHAVLGLVRSRRGSERTELGGSPTLRAIQAVTGALVLGFLLYHLKQAWMVEDGPHSSPYAAYAALWQALGRPSDLAIYLVGVTAVCFHLGHGLSRAAVSWGLARGPRQLLYWRVGAGALGFVLWAMMLQLLAHFALGQALLPTERG
jgi:succinate dehydrogenase / fumarate reductase cytochrome b subunit